MATAIALNLEASLPAERKLQRLPPKSYLDATEENLGTTSRSPRRIMHKKSGSSRINGYSKDSKDPAVVVERYEDKDGEHLVSIKQEWDGEKSSIRRDSVLVSGRKAGAGWEHSG